MEETLDGCVQRDEDEGQFYNIHGDELGTGGHGVIGTMDKENILVHISIWGAR